MIPGGLAGLIMKSSSGGTAGSATGGYTYQNGANAVHMFPANDNFIVSSPLTASYLIISGGGSGGGGTGGGGGAGGMVSGSASISAATYPIVVGAGGAAAANGVNGNNGANSSFNGVTATHGGAGGRDQITSPSTGGSGGGGGTGAAATGAAGTAGQGSAGGNGGAYGGNYPCGGGGGAGAVGGNFSGTTIAGNGGAGSSSSITGTATNYAGGGGGGTYGGGTTGTGGAGGGNAGKNATPYSGGGGGGGVSNTTSGAGGSGIVIVSYVGTAPVMDYTTGLVGKWTFEASDGADSSGNGNNGTLYNTPTFGTGHKGGTAITFPATGYMTIPYVAGIDIVNTLTVAFWVKFTSNGNYVIIERYNGSNNSYSIQSEIGGIVSFTEPGQRLDSIGGFNDGNWHHVACTYQQSNTTSKIYVDGVLYNTSTTNVGPVSNTQPLLMGSRSGTFGFTGSLDDVYLFNRVLTPIEIFGLSQQ